MKKLPAAVPEAARTDESREEGIRTMSIILDALRGHPGALDSVKRALHEDRERERERKRREEGNEDR